MSDNSGMMADRPPNYAENTAERVPCMLVLDASESMGAVDSASGRKCIEMLNDGIKALRDELHTDQIALARVQLAAIIVGGFKDEATLLMDWTDAGDFVPFELKAGSRTPLGAGILMALNEIKKQKGVLKDNGIPYYRPWMFVMTDGEPTDDAAVWREACKKARESESEARKEVLIYPVGIGNAKLTTLSELSVTKPMHINGMKFREFFKWVSGSISVRVRSAPGQKIKLPGTDGWADPWTSVNLEA